MAHYPDDLHEHVRGRAAELGIRPEDIEEFHTSGHGHGGQKINKSQNCVELTHHPSGITVRYQHHRGLNRNRVEAYALLIQKLDEHATSEKQARATEEHRKAAEERGRSRKGQERTLEEKRRRSVIKKLRKPSTDPSAPVP